MNEPEDPPCPKCDWGHLAIVLWPATKAGKTYYIETWMCYHTIADSGHHMEGCGYTRTVEVKIDNGKIIRS